MHNVKRSHKTTVSSQVAPLALVPMLSTRLGHMHCHIAWNCPIDIITRIATLPWSALLALSVSIELVYSSARVTSVKFQKGVSVSQFERTGPIDRTPGTPGSDKQQYKKQTISS